MISPNVNVAVELLEQSLRRKRKRCMIGTGSMSDPYIHLEETLKNTRKCLELIRDYGFGLAIQTKLPVSSGISGRGRANEPAFVKITCIYMHTSLK